MKIKTQGLSQVPDGAYLDVYLDQTGKLETSRNDLMRIFADV